MKHSHDFTEINVLKIFNKIILNWKKKFTKI